MNKRLLVLLLSSTIGISAIAQNTLKPESFRKGKFIEIAGIVSGGTVKDEITSPLYYSSKNSGLKAEYSVYSRKSIFSLNLSTIGGVHIASHKDKDTEASQSSVELNATYAKPINTSMSENIRFLPGISLDNYFSIRINESLENAALTVDMINSISLNFGAEYFYHKPRLRKKILGITPFWYKEMNNNIFTNIKLPILSSYLRPRYTNPGNVTVVSSESIIDALSNYKLNISSMIGLNIETGIATLLPNGNMIKYSYKWNIVSIGKKTINRFNEANHVLAIGLVFKMK